MYLASSLWLFGNDTLATMVADTRHAIAEENPDTPVHLKDEARMALVVLEAEANGRGVAI